MDVLGVNVVGLDGVVGECAALTRRLSSLPAPSGSGPAGQATKVAVSAVHTGIGSTGAALIVRIQSTAARLAAASTAYADRDSTAADNLRSAGDALEA